MGIPTGVSIACHPKLSVFSITSKSCIVLALFSFFLFYFIIFLFFTFPSFPFSKSTRSGYGAKSKEITSRNCDEKGIEKKKEGNEKRMREIRVVQRIGQSYDPPKRVLRFLFFSLFHFYLSSFSLSTFLYKISSFLKIHNANIYNTVMLVKNHLICFASSLTLCLFENQTYAFRAQFVLFRFIFFFSLFINHTYRTPGTNFYFLFSFLLLFDNAIDYERSSTPLQIILSYNFNNSHACIIITFCLGFL